MPTTSSSPAALAPALTDGWHLASAERTSEGAQRRCGAEPASDHRRPCGWMPTEFQTHGRYVEADTGGLTVASVYIQTGEAGTDRQLEKERFMAALAHRMAALTATGRDAVVCGDWNVAHTENDIKNWKGNVKKSGFLPSERKWLTDLLAAGWVDVVRVLHPDVPGPYSWWSWRGRAFDNDAGWRIDYQLATQGPGGAGHCCAGGAGGGLRAALVRPRTGDRGISGLTGSIVG